MAFKLLDTERIKIQTSCNVIDVFIVFIISWQASGAIYSNLGPARAGRSPAPSLEIPAPSGLGVVASLIRQGNRENQGIPSPLTVFYFCWCESWDV
jgi:hypothetical protein